MKIERDLLLKSYLKRLRLPTVAASYKKIAEESLAGKKDYADYLLALMEQEVINREANALRNKISLARFPVIKGLDTFDFSAVKDLNQQTILQLANCDYLDRKENIILIGPAGVGKTHLATALGVAACKKGKRIRFCTTAGLINEMLEAKDSHALNKFQARLLKFDLVILDELGYVPFTAGGGELLFQFCSERYERGSLIITTNLEFGNWVEVFGNERMTAALLDRLTHRCHILEIKGESYRFKESKKRRAH
ncbi:MAG: IS21-like element helper ATPase IstB [Candidatus Omnitrophica bacterium]|nr:IS21-like element helper ATPase IstB [Candidatus Omnitrophota bacterium]